MVDSVRLDFAKNQVFNTRHHWYLHLTTLNSNIIQLRRFPTFTPNYKKTAAPTYLATITNYYRRHGFEFDCNQEATLVRGAKPLRLQLKFHLVMVARYGKREFISYSVKFVLLQTCKKEKLVTKMFPQTTVFTLILYYVVIRSIIDNIPIEKRHVTIYHNTMCHKCMTNFEI